jgi:hypothetical protein
MVKANENLREGEGGSEITPPQLSHALHSCSASHGVNPIGWATTLKGGAAHVHSGNELAVEVGSRAELDCPI